MAKQKIELGPKLDVDAILKAFKEKYEGVEGAKINDIDGIKVDFESSWVHLRKSNTEPIIRIYTEASTQEQANALASDVIKEINSIS
jgi:phosphomannomutase